MRHIIEIQLKETNPGTASHTRTLLSTWMEVKAVLVLRSSRQQIYKTELYMYDAVEGK
jgi:hypothetical protein